MSYFETNLGDPNTFWRITEEFSVYFRNGTEPTNCWYGSAQIYRAKYRYGSVEVNGEIHNLCGGLFYVSPFGAVSEIVLERNSKDPFEKRYWPDKHNFPLAKLQRLTEQQKRNVPRYRVE